MSNVCEKFASIMIEGTLKPPSLVAQIVLIFLIIINILTFPFAAFLNALVMIAVKKKSRLRANKSNILLALTATTDVTVGIIVQPAFVLLMITFLLNEATLNISCPILIHRAAISCLCDISLLHIALISGERYLAMKHTFAYITLVTETRLLVASVCTWILCIVLHIPLFINVFLAVRVFIPTNNIFICICFSFIVFCQVTVYREIRRHKQQIAAQHATEETRKQFLNDQKAFKLTTIIVAVLLFCFIPTFVLRILIGKYGSSTFSVETNYLSFFSVVTVMLLNSLLNPLIYSIRMRQFRVAFIELLTCRSENIAEAEEINMRIFRLPNAVVSRLEAEQLDGLENQSVEPTNGAKGTEFQ